MSFREKFNWVVLAVTALLLAMGVGWYGLRASTGDPGVAVAPVLLAYLVWFAAMLAGTVIVAAKDPKEAGAPADERDRIINMKAALPAMHLYGFALTGLIAAVFFGLDKGQVLYALVAIQFIATIVEAGAKIHFYRMPI